MPTAAIDDAVLNSQALLSDVFSIPIPGVIEAALRRLLGICEMGKVYESLRSMGDVKPLFNRLLRHLEVTYRVAGRDRDQIPQTGPTVVVVNHPFGILEGAVIAEILSGVRTDVKVLANGVLAAIPEIRDLIIPVDPMGGSRALQGNPRGIRQSLQHLAQGGLLMVFPAGEVSHFQWRERRIKDPHWNPSIARILAAAHRRTPGISVVPIHVDGANGALFQALGLVHPRLRTALLVRELLNKRRTQVTVRIGSAIPVEKLLAIPTDEGRTQYLRWRTDLLASRTEYRPRTSLPLSGRSPRTASLEPVAQAVPHTALAREVRDLDAAALLAKSGDLSTYVAAARQIPAVLAEIGRLRELTFRAAGEGTGRALDLDEFDASYLHLFVWNEHKQEVVGAYRLTPVDHAKPPKIYTATLFEYEDEFLNRLGPAIELGRSFVRAEYQKGLAPLLLLWKGIGRYVARNPRYKVLFGPVSISNGYQPISRELMVSFLERHASLKDWVGLISSRNPFRNSRRTSATVPADGFDIEDLSAVVSDLEPSRAGVPVLLRQYLKLGGKLLGFNVDPKFSNTLDGLILVDLTLTEPKLLERYLGKSEAAEFLAFQKGRNGTR